MFGNRAPKFFPVDGSSAGTTPRDASRCDTVLFSVSQEDSYCAPEMSRLSITSSTAGPSTPTFNDATFEWNWSVEEPVHSALSSLQAPNIALRVMAR